MSFSKPARQMLSLPDVDLSDAIRSARDHSNANVATVAGAFEGTWSAATSIRGEAQVLDLLLTDPADAVQLHCPMTREGHENSLEIGDEKWGYVSFLFPVNVALSTFSVEVEAVALQCCLLSRRLSTEPFEVVATDVMVEQSSRHVVDFVIFGTEPPICREICIAWRLVAEPCAPFVMHGIMLSADLVSEKEQAISTIAAVVSTATERETKSMTAGDEAKPPVNSRHTTTRTHPTPFRADPTFQKSAWSKKLSRSSTARMT
jgi:hypothetical protein